MEDTKSEKFTEFEQLIVQVAEIYRMANDDEAARVKMLKEQHSMRLKLHI